MSRCVKVDTLGRLCDDDLERFYNHFITTNIYLIGAAYNSYFLTIYKLSSLIISPRTFSTQLGAGTAWFCLSQCAIPFCTLSLRRQGPCFSSGIHIHGDSHRWSGQWRLWNNWRGGARGNLATDNGGGQVETVLSEAEGVERDTD